MDTHTADPAHRTMEVLCRALIAADTIRKDETPCVGCCRPAATDIGAPLCRECAALVNKAIALTGLGGQR